MSMSIVHNNENDVPVDGIQNRPTLKPSFKSLNEVSKVEKRPRGLKTRDTSGIKRAVLGDVTNKISIKKSTIATALSKRKLTTLKRTVSSNLSTTTATISAKTFIHESLTPTKPLESLGIVDQMSSSPMSLSSTSYSMVMDEHGILEQIEDGVDIDDDNEDDDEDTQIKEQENYDIDSKDRDDEACCWQYAHDITKYYLDTEKDRCVSASYMTNQADINSKMRAILVDWIVDVHFKFKLLPQTLYIAVHLIDDYLARDFEIRRQRLQLVGVTALFIASKYEEIYPPEAEDYVRITDNAYTKDEIFEMEETLLGAIGYRVTFPTAYQFLKRFLKASKTTDDRVEHFAHYVIDRSLQEYKLLKYPPSAIAAAAVHVAKTQMNDNLVWNSVVEYHSSYTEKSLSGCIDDLKEILWQAQNGVGKINKLTAVRRKFERERFMGVSTYPLSFAFDDNL